MSKRTGILAIAAAVLLFVAFAVYFFVPTSVIKDSDHYVLRSISIILDEEEVGALFRDEDGAFKTTGLGDEMNFTQESEEALLTFFSQCMELRTLETESKQSKGAISYEFVLETDKGAVKRIYVGNSVYSRKDEGLLHRLVSGAWVRESVEEILLGTL